MLADRFGRRILLIGDFLAYVVASVGSAFAGSFVVLFIFRFIVGIGIGADFAVAFTYLSEITPSTTRGMSMATVMMAANFGMILAYGLGGAFLNVSDQGWRYVLAAGGLLAVPVILLRGGIYESEAWMRHKHSRFVDIVKGLNRKELKKVFVSSAAWFSYQVGDQGLSIFLPILLLTTLGTDDSLSSYGSLLVKSVTIPAALLTVLLIERIGRKPLQIYGFLGRFILLFILSGVLLYYGGRQGVLEIIILLLAYFFGAMGPDKTTVISPAEQFNTDVRATGQGITESVGRFGGIVGVFGYGILSVSVGAWAGIVFFGVFALIGFGVSMFMKETMAT